jgi:hypothetical protein
MCLIIQCILLFEAILGITYLFFSAKIDTTTFNWQTLLSLLITMPLPLLLWLSIKHILQNGIQFDNYRYAYLRLLHNTDVFNLILQKQHSAPSGYEDCSLLFGNPNAQNEIIKVCNPYCRPCSKVHPILEDILNNNNTKLWISFVINGEKSEQKHKVVNHFIMLYYQKGPLVAQNAMHYWYSNINTRDPDSLIEKFPLSNEDISNTNVDIKTKMAFWQEQANIKYTPTIYVNGYILPKDYTVETLKNIL